ncbi:MAG: hypothetical protein BA874_06530 [Desulfuromonadales bacterium C00003068]|nr:MAG: hypothetical protein BA874_06530 [Desulfuromonadales bacterium C00003068]
MKLYIKCGALFIVIMLFLSALIWNRYQALCFEHLKMREAAFRSAYASISNTFRLVSKTIVDEVLQQPEILKLVHDVVTSEGEQRYHARGLLYRALSPLYERVSQHSVQQLHFHFPNNHSMLRFHLPQKSDDDLTPVRPSVRRVNEQHSEVHGYESGCIVTGFRHVYPLSYQGRHIGSVEVSNSFQQLRHELSAYASDFRFQFMMLKTELWGKLIAGQQELYVASLLHDDYLCENRQTSLYQHFSEVDDVREPDELLSRLKNNQAVQAGIETGEEFYIVDSSAGQVTSILFHSIKNTDGQHAAYILSIHAEPYLVSLRLSALVQLMVSMAFAFVVVAFRIKNVKHRAEKKSARLFLQTVTNHIGEGLYTTDKEGLVTFFNPEALRILGYENSEVIGCNAHDLFHGKDLQHQQKGCVILNTIMNEVTYQQQQAIFVHKNKCEFPVELTCTPIRKMGKIVGTITLFHDITQRCQQEQALNHTQAALKQANLSLEKLSRIDGLTGIANRREYDQSIVMLWKMASRRNEPLALLMIDIDHFKAYNDTYGHVQGDDCLRRVATVIKNNCLRPEDFVARYGGEEFAVMLPNTSLEDACRVAQRICRALEREHIPHDGSEQYRIVTLSIGGHCVYPNEIENVENLVRYADQQLYLAKESGRNRACFNCQK